MPENINTVLPEAFNLTPRKLVCPRIPAPSIDGKIEIREWKRARRVTGMTFNDQLPAQPKTAFWLGHDDSFFYAAIRCATHNTSALRQYTGSNNYPLPDQVMLYFDTAHNHVNLRRFDFGPFGQVEVFKGSCTVGYRDGPDSRWFHEKYESALPNYCRSATHVEEGKHWSLEVAIPFESLGVPPPARGTVWGINIRRHTQWPVFTDTTNNKQADPRQHQDILQKNVFFSAWPNHPNGHPSAFADLVFDDEDALQLDRLDIGVPHFGENRSIISFMAPHKRIPLVLKTLVRSRCNGTIIDPGRETPLRRGKTGELKAEMVWKPFHSDDTNVLDIEVKRAANGRIEWRGSYDFGWESGSLPLHYLHRGESKVLPPDPKPGDPDFLRKKAEFIAGHQPRFQRINTSQGAPSDFTLQSRDGKIRFNLMEAGVTDIMATYIHNLYDTDSDRLLGMMFFMAQPCMMRANTAYDPHGAHRLNPLSKLRFGSGYCGHMGQVLSPLVNRMKNERTDCLHQARSAMIGGHVMTMVEYGDDYILLDPKHCCMLYRSDNKDLATLSEIRRTPEIARRAYPQIMPALMTFDECYVSAAAPDIFNAKGLSFPPNAPYA